MRSLTVTLASPFHWLRQLFATWSSRSPFMVDIVPVTFSVIVGLVTGYASFIFIRLIEFITEFFTEAHHEYGTIALFGGLIFGGLTVGLMIQTFFPEVKGGGVPDVMEAVALRRGRIRRRVAPAKILASAITIGTGGSVGREGPIVFIGGGIGSTIGRIAKLSEENVSILVAAGAGGGIAAAFNAPIAGSMFALELILGKFTKRNMEAVIIACISANVVSRGLLGTQPAFAVPAYPLDSAWELPLYVLLGILCALGAVIFIHMLHISERLFERLRVPIYIQTTLGMVLTGCVALLAPEILGSGLEFIGEAISDNVDLALGVLVGLFFLKALGTIFTLGSGNSGGDLAPTLFLGAIIGMIVGHIGNELWPEVVINPGSFAIVGMASMFAGAARAPITAMILVLEMSNDYRLVVPLMLGVVVSTLLADLMLVDSIYTLKLSLRGIRLQRGQDVDVLQSVSVADVMSPGYETVAPTMTLVDLIVKFNRSHHHGFPIVDDRGILRGIVTLTDVENAQEKGIPFDATVMEFGTIKNFYIVYPDDPIYLALRRMNAYGIGRLPVITHGEEERYLGLIRREDILKAYDLGLMRKSIELHREARFKLRDIENSNFLEFDVVKEAPMAGHALSEFPMSDCCLVLSIRRKGSSIIPHGSAKVEAGDHIVVYVEKEHQTKVLEQFVNLDDEPAVPQKKLISKH